MAQTARSTHRLADGAEALSHMLDVTSRAQERVRAVPAAMPVAAGAAIVLGIALGAWRRHGRGD